MSKGRKKIRHRKIINGGAGEEEEQQKSQETSQEKCERMEEELLRYNKEKYGPLIITYKKMYPDSNLRVTHLGVLYKSFLAEKKRLEKEQSPLSENEKEQLQKILNNYFELKEKKLQFKKDCISSKLFTSNCKEKVIERIKEFLTQLYHLLQTNENRESIVEQPTVSPTVKSVVSTDGLKDFFKEIHRLKKLESCQQFSDLTSKNIESVVEYLGDKLSEDDKKMVSTIETLFPEHRSIELDDYQQQIINTAKNKAAADTENNTSNTKLSDVIDELVNKIKEKGKRNILNAVIPLMEQYNNTSIPYEELLVKLGNYLSELSQGGGSQFVRRNKRKTKKEIKNKNKNKHKLSKKHHHRTKRHTKRHRKTKRNTKRH